MKISRKLWGAVLSMILLLLALFWILRMRPMPESHAPGGDMHVGMIFDDCAPWDGAALRMMLPLNDASAFPSLMVSVWDGALPKTFRYDSKNYNDNKGAVMYCVKENECNNVRTATVTFSSSDPHEKVDGAYDVTLDSGETLKGTLKATWEKNQKMVLCR